MPDKNGLMGTWLSRSVLFLLVTCLLWVYVGRRMGWWISRKFLYSISTPACVVALCLWGGFTALVLRLLIDYMHPSLFAKVLGYGAAAYVAYPAFGLVNESTIPDHAMDRHHLINTLPIAAFILTAIVLAILSR
jgi:hypothetical protein